MSMKKITSQRVWQLKQVALGKCSLCGNKLFQRELCLKHYRIALKRSKEWHLKNKEHHLALMKARREKIKIMKGAL